MNNLINRELNISKIVNLQMSETLVNVASETCKVVPFDHNLLLDVGLYNRLSDDTGAIYSTSGAERKVCYDKWSNKTYQYIKVSNDSGEEKYSTQPKYEFNKNANQKNGFVTYKGVSPVFSKSSFTYLFMTALKVVKTILSDDYFIATHGNLMGNLNRQLRGMVKDYLPDETTANKIYSLSEEDLVVMLCTYSTYFLQINFVEPNPEVTNEHRYMEKVLNTIHKNQKRVLTPAVKAAYLDFLGILSRGLEIGNYNGEWVGKSSTMRKFNHEIMYTFTKYRKVHMAGATGTFIKFIESLEDELNILVGYHPALTDINSAEKLMYNQNYRELRRIFIRPFIEHSKTYDECANKVVQDMSKDISYALKDAITFLETAENIKHSLECNKMLTEEAKNIIVGQITDYASKKKRYLDRVMSNIDVGIFLISDETNPTFETIYKDAVNLQGRQELSNGFLPFGLTFFKEGLADIYYDQAEPLMFSVAQQYATHSYETFTPVYSPLLYKLLQTTQSDRLPLSARRDDIENKCRACEIELLNAVLTTFLRNTLKQVNHSKGPLAPVLTINSQVTSTCMRMKADDYLRYAEQLQNGYDTYNGPEPKSFYESLGHMYLSIAEELERTNELISVDALIDNMTQISVHANIYLLSNIDLIRQAVSEKQPGYSDAELFSTQFIQGDAIENTVETARQINSYLMDFYVSFSEAYPTLKNYYTNFHSYLSTLNPEDVYRKAWEVEHIKLYDTNDLKHTNDFALLENGIRHLLAEHLKGCMIELEDCSVTGHLKREVIDVYKEYETFQILPFFDVSTIDIKLSLPYIEFYDILNSNDEMFYGSVCKRGTTFQNGMIQPWS